MAALRLPSSWPPEQVWRGRMIAVLIAIALVVSQGASTRVCQVYKCGMDFTQKLESDKVPVKPNARYCFLLRQYGRCLNETRLVCRGVFHYHSVQAMVRQQSAKFACADRLSGVGAVAQYDRCLSPIAAPTAGPPATHLVCSLFGDPHLRTFDGQYSTCATEGAWPLVDNKYFGVQVTMAARLPNATSTHISKVTVIVQAVRGCTAQKLYEAAAHRLPGRFVDGTQRVRVAAETTVQLIVHERGRHVELRLEHVDSSVVVRRHGERLSVVVATPPAVVHAHTPPDSGQLCVRGCPRWRSVAIGAALATPTAFARCHGAPPPVVAKDVALSRCKAARLRGYYLDACAFDVTFSGDDHYRDAARHALADLRERLSAEALTVDLNRTATMHGHALPHACLQAGNGARTLASRHAALLLVFFTCGILRLSFNGAAH